MVCPYCETKNIPGAQVCAHCGAILRDIPRARPAPRERAHFGGSAKALFAGAKWRAEHAHVQSRIKNALTHAVTRYEEQLKTPGSHAETRLGLAAAHVLHDRVDRAVQEFQQAQQLGAKGAELYNNGGVALARRGSLTQAIEMFDRAVAALDPQDARVAAPHANLAHALSRLAEGQGQDVAEHALREVQTTVTRDPKNPTHYNRLGLIFCLEERYEEALVQFGQALALGGSEMAQADAHNNRGMALALSGDSEAAAREFDAALKQDSGHGRALANRALLSLRMGAHEGEIEKLHHAARIDSQSALVRNGYGYALSQGLAINEGIREFKDALGLDAVAFEPYYNQGKSYADEGLYDIAERYLTRALQIHPHSWQALVAMGVIRMGQHQLPQALQCLQSANSLCHNQTVVLSDLGLCLALSHQDAPAERLFRQASLVAKADPEINLHLGWLCLRRKNISQGLAELDIALSRNDNLAVGHANAGLCEIEMAHWDEALRHFRRALQIDPSLGQVHHFLGFVYGATNQLDQAVKEWELAIKASPMLADAHSDLGVALFKKGQYESAAAEFRRVVGMRQNRMEDYSNLALAYARQGMALRQQSRKSDDLKAKEAQEKQQTAVKMFDAALALQSGNVMLHSNRGLACFFANRPEDAMREWTTVTRLDPVYARRRGKVQQSEFDESVVAFVPLDAPSCAIALPPKTADYQFRYAPSYDVEEWELLLSDPELQPVPGLIRQCCHLDRLLKAH